MEDIEKDLEELTFADSTVVQVPPQVLEYSTLKGRQDYDKLYAASMNDLSGFWRKAALDMLTWFHRFEKVCNVDLSQPHSVPVDGHVIWFEGGKLNACYNALDRHIDNGLGYKVALFHEGNEPGQSRRFTFIELRMRVCQVANAMRSLGVRQGDIVTIYMPMVPEAAFTMLACARIGAVANVVFAGFSSEALAARIQDGGSRILFTASRAHRGDRTIPLFSIVKEALLKCPSVQDCVVLNTSGECVSNDADPSSDTEFPHSSPLYVGVKFYDFMSVVDSECSYCPAVWMDSEDPLFVLYTSGSTGKPKGIIHTTAGYLLYAAITHKYVFDIQPDDVYACVADIGWITGHSYILWGPLVNGCTTLMFEATPLYPSPYRYWDLVQRYAVTKIYTAPTAIRALMKHSDKGVSNYDLSSLKVLGTVGEPINPSAWNWYFEVVGRSSCTIVDTYWMTESGGVLMTPLPGAAPMKPGSCSLPFFGIQPVVINPITGKAFKENDVRGLMGVARPWPGMTRTVFGDFQRFRSTYLQPYPGNFFTGDGVYRDKDGYYWIIGRVDDVINVSGHRLGTAELESALVSSESCSEAAVVGVAHPIKGQAIHAYCVIRHGFEYRMEKIPTDLAGHVRRVIGGIAVPDKIWIVPALPKTRSGKIMRRLLRKISNNQVDSLGDITTLADPWVVSHIIDLVGGSGAS